jgi:hypothetical protein
VEGRLDELSTKYERTPSLIMKINNLLPCSFQVREFTVFKPDHWTGTRRKDAPFYSEKMQLAEIPISSEYHEIRLSE